MQCSSIKEMLSAYLDGVLEPSEHALVTRHLEMCPACRSEWEDLCMVVEMVRELPEITPPADFRLNLRKRLEAIPINTSPAEKKARGFWRTMTGSKISRGIAVAATVILTAGVTALWYGIPGQPGGNSVNDIASSGKSAVIKEKVSLNNNTDNLTMDQNAKVLGDQLVESDQPTASAHQSKNNSGIAAQQNLDRGERAFAFKSEAPAADEKLIDMAAGDDSESYRARMAPPGMGGGEMAGIAAVPQSSEQSGESRTIKQASLKLDVADVDQVTQKVSNIIWSYGGMVAANNASGSGSLEIRVPSARFDEALEQIQVMGKVVDKKVATRDVTSDFNNTVSSLIALENQANVFNGENQGEAGGSGSGAAVTGGGEFKVLQQEKEIRQNQLRELEDASVMATINVHLE